MPPSLNSLIYGSPKNKRQNVSTSQRNVVADNQKNKCYFCKKPLNRSFTHFDHIKEVSRGGKSKTSNLRAVCANCHAERHNRDKAAKADKRRTTKKTNSFGIPNLQKEIKLPRLF